MGAGTVTSLFAAALLLGGAGVSPAVGPPRGPARAPLLRVDRVVRPLAPGIVAALPVGFVTVAVRGETYYLAEGVWYRREPAGYVAVEAPERSGSVVVEPALLNVRSGPSLAFPVAARVARGEQLVILGEADGWLLVRLPDGACGWVMRRFTRAPAVG